MEKDNVKEILKKLLEVLTVRFREIERHDSAVHPVYHIATDDAPILIGAGGENLRALNYIAKRIVERMLGAEHTHFLLDVNGYQRKRIEAIEQQARMLAERARTFKSDVAMNPLNAYERMIVHNLFSDDHDVTTESVGEGKQRHVVFHCRGSFARAETNDSLLIE
ncbi:MAG TPA: R3H domain-containing nucleic acid-binding protein [Candidatus Paceibacterota bacterium]|jgi:spoIIIJ-associated protein